MNKLDELRDVLKKLTGESEVKNSNFWHFFFVKNIGTKIGAVSLSFIIWVIFFAQVGIIKKEYSIPLSFQLLSPALEIDANSGKKLIKIVVEGKSSDINSLAVDKIQVRVDAKDFVTGTEKITIEKSMINVPAFINISEIVPQNVSVIVTEKTQ